MKWKYYLLSTLMVLAIFTFIIPIAYFTWTGRGWMNLQDNIMKKYNPELYNKPNRREFFTKWY